MRSLLWLLCSPWVVAVLGAISVGALGACMDAPVAGGAPIARVVAAWDPLACGDPHRVAIELADDDGASVSGSAPCVIGGVTVDVGHFGSYRGRVYAWAPGAPVRSETPLEVMVDEPIVRCMVATPR
ncbi:MAG TPA: hypothetical protein VLM79_07895 [Kofleriaceae bacterium]|nr:hypothetical protein [Kofleriaceae bacterium]